MPVFYFHLVTPQGGEWDEIGISCPDIETAYLEAHRAIPEMAATLLRSGTDPMQCRYDIANSDGDVVISLPFDELAVR